MRFMSAHLHHPQQDGTEHDDDENFKTNSLISRDGSVTIPDASSWSQFTGTLSFPGTNIKGADSCGVGSSSIVRCNATVSVSNRKKALKYVYISVIHSYRKGRCALTLMSPFRFFLFFFSKGALQLGSSSTHWFIRRSPCADAFVSERPHPSADHSQPSNHSICALTGS